MPDPNNMVAAGAGGPTSIPLTTLTPLRRTPANRVFAVIYAFAILALFYHHAWRFLLHRPNTMASTVAAISLVIADAILAFHWISAQSYRMFPVRWEEHPEKLSRATDFPALDVFVCTADPYKEPPMGVVNTALSVMAYEYPANKVSVYVSDDGGSELTLFAFLEAAKFAREWLPFCRRNKVMERSPEAYFSSNPCSQQSEKIKIMYESMKMRVEDVMERGKVGDDYITGDDEREALSKWTDTFTRQNHPTIIKVLVDTNEDKDNAGNQMPNLIYVSREKRKNISHHFKAGALNALIRVSAVMTNAPLILTLDCDMRSNDPGTPHRVLCHLLQPSVDHVELGFIQFPQRFHGINKDDIYSAQYKPQFQQNPMGMKNGPNYVGTGCFFRRRALFGGPRNYVAPEIPELSHEHTVRKPVQSQEIVELAHHVAGCNYEDRTTWGSKIGFRYGTLVEDFYTGYRLQCEGWKSIFCDPHRAAFLGDAPISLIDILNQNKRWSIGLLEVGFSRYSPISFGVRSMGLHMGLCYAHYGFWPIWTIPVTIYAFVPQLALINGLSIFPKVSESWFFLYLFLFCGAYSQDLIEYMTAIHGGSIRRWWNDQRMWFVRSLTSFMFGTVEFMLMSLGISVHGFNVTSKINDDEQHKKYEQGVFEFGASSPMFVSLSVAAIVNLFSFVRAAADVAVNGGRRVEVVQGLAVQIMLAGFGVVNGWPVYEAMFLRTDKGKMPTRVTLTAVVVASLLCTAASVIARVN